MARIPLTLQGITWCWRHGHPIVGLQAQPEQVFWITLSTDDAQALSPMYQGHNTGRSRVYELLESTLESLGARIAAISIGLSSSGVLQGMMTIEGIFGRQTRPIHTVDAIVLAQRSQLAIEIDEGDLERICPAEDADHVHPISEAAASNAMIETPESFRVFIESLDLGQLDYNNNA